MKIEDTIVLNEKLNIVEKALEKLGKDSKLIFRMYYFNSMKIKDISEKIHISEYNVTQKLYRTRKC